MDSIKEYVISEFWETNPRYWSDSMIHKFIQASISLDTDVYEAITDIDTDDLKQYLAEFGSHNIEREVISIQAAMIVNAKEQINEIIKEISDDLENEDYESDAELRAEFERTELKAMGRI